MNSVERPSVRARRSAVRASAAAASRCSAGSSRTRIGKSARRARATATRWRWPPERRAPMEPTSVARPLGRPDEPAAEADAGEDVGQLLVAGRAPADPEVLGQRGVEEVGTLLHQAHHVSHVVRGQPLHRDPVEGRRLRRRPAGSARGRRPASTCRRRSGPTRATRRPGPQVQVDAAQRRAPGAGVGGPHVAQRPAHGVRRPPVAGTRGRPPPAARPWRRRPAPPPPASAAGPAWRRAAGTRARRPPAGPGRGRRGARR